MLRVRRRRITGGEAQVRVNLRLPLERSRRSSLRSSSRAHVTEHLGRREALVGEQYFVSAVEDALRRCACARGAGALNGKARMRNVAAPHHRSLEACRCRKTHLFDINIPGKITFRESDTLTGGTALTTATTRYGTLGIGICYDLRFPELAAICQQRGAQLLVYPGAFNMTTGPLHWSLLQRARAVDNQLFVCTCSPARDEEFSYVAWGHSLVVGPFGEVLNELEHEEGVLYQELDFGEARTRRENMPLEQQRRADLYEVVDKGIEYHQ